MSHITPVPVTCLPSPEDDLFTFGLGQFGQLGHGTFTFESRLPRPVEHFRRGRVCQVTCGENHTAVVTGERHTPPYEPTASSVSRRFLTPVVLLLFQTEACCTRLETADMENWAWETRTSPTSSNQRCVPASSTTTFRPSVFTIRAILFIFKPFICTLV